MKRIIALVLSMSLLLGMATSLSGCDSNANNVVKVGQWLSMINEAFGMESYTHEEPYFSNINADNPYFGVVQTAAEWEVVDSTASTIDVNQSLTWQTALITLVNAGNFVAQDTDDESKIDYALEAFDKTVRKYWMNRSINYHRAVILLTAAQELWANRRYEENVENISYKENVDNLVEQVKENYIVDGNQVIIPEDVSGQIQEGDIYMLRSQENPEEYTYYRAQEVVTGDGATYISNSDEELELEDVAQEVFIQGTVTPTTENTVVYDGNGNLISSPQIVQQRKSMGMVGVTPVGIAKTAATVKHTFEVEGTEVSLSYNLDGALDFKIGVKSENLLGKNSSGKLKLESSYELSNLEVTREFDYGIIKGLKHASLKVDYETKQKFGVSYSNKPIDLVAAPKNNGNGKFLTNFKKAFLKEADAKGAKTIASKKVIKVCSLNIYNAAVAKVCLDVNLELSVEGSFSVTVTQGGTSGVEYKNGNLRFIKKATKSVEAELKAKIELTLGVGPALYLVGLKKCLLGLEVKLGAGASCSVTWHLADAEMHLVEEMTFPDLQPELCESCKCQTATVTEEEMQKIAAEQGGVYKAASATIDLHIDSCFEVSIYAILKVGLTDYSYATQLLGGKVKTTCTVLDSKNATFFKYHVDNWKWSEGKKEFNLKGVGNLCTLEYKPFDTEEVTTTTETATTTQADESVSFGEFIALSDFRAEIAPGGTYCVMIKQLPKGYSLGDIVYETSDRSVATVNALGVVQGKKSGNVSITVKTKDGKYYAAIAVAVTENTKVEFEGLKVVS